MPDPLALSPDSASATRLVAVPLSTRRRTASAPEGDDCAAAIDALDQAATQAPLGTLPALIGQLVALEERVRLRLRQGAPTSTAHAARDENLSAAEAARRLGISRNWLYSHASSLPFALRIGRRIVFSSHGLERWNRQRHAD
jgi:predicted DNA-binding transcriptional regulator AlpA